MNKMLIIFAYAFVILSLLGLAKLLRRIEPHFDKFLERKKMDEYSNLFKIIIIIFLFFAFCIICGLVGNYFRAHIIII